MACGQLGSWEAAGRLQVSRADPPLGPRGALGPPISQLGLCGVSQSPEEMQAPRHRELLPSGVQALLGCSGCPEAENGIHRPGGPGQRGRVSHRAANPHRIPHSDGLIP